VTGKATVVADSFTCVPVPDKAIDCGLPPPLSVIAIDPTRPAIPLGEKVTEIVQLAPAPTDIPQVFVWLKSAPFAPPTDIPEVVRVVVPTFVSVTFFAALFTPSVVTGKTRLAADT